MVKIKSFLFFIALFIALLFILIFIPTKVNASDSITTIQFVDTNLYMAVKSQIPSKIINSSDNNKTIMITYSNLMSIRGLNLAGKNIVYLNGLDKFYNLSSLNLRDNYINNVSYLRTLTNLSYLNLANNRISNLSYLSYLPNLNYLYLGDNLISDVSVIGRFTKLKTLSLDNNQIADISSFSSLQNLTTLSLEANRVSDVSAIATLSNLTSLNLKNQEYEYSLNGNALANINTNVNLPTFFLQAKQSTSPIYTASSFTVTGANIGTTPSYIILRNTTAGQKTATVRINGGNADGSTLTLKYNSVLITVTSSTSSPDTIYEGVGGAISFSVTANGETSTQAISFQIMKNNVDVTNQFLITKSSSSNISYNVRIGVPNSVSSGTYMLYVKYNNKTAVSGSFVIHEKIPVSSVQLNYTNLSMNVNENTVLRATVFPSNATNQNLNWYSSAPSIVSVNQDGSITAKDAGTAVITVTSQDGNKSANCTIVVSKPVTGVSLNMSNTVIFLNETQQLLATVTPSDATNKNLVWQSSNSQIATVTQTGLVYGNSVGSTSITVTTLDGNYSATCQVVVKENVPTPPENIPVQSVTLNKTSLQLTEGDSETLKATISPTNATNTKLVWSSANPSIASVDSTGKVTAKALGSTQIIVIAEDNSAGTKQAICNITVTARELISSSYKIEGNLILGISPYSTVKSFLDQITIPFSYKLYNVVGDELSQDSLVGTGTQLVLDGSLRYTLVVTGDLTGDGKLLSSDVLILKRHLVKTETISGIYAKSADVNMSSSITLTDLLQLKMATIHLIEF